MFPDTAFDCWGFVVVFFLTSAVLWIYQVLLSLGHTAFLFVVLTFPVVCLFSRCSLPFCTLFWCTVGCFSFLFLLWELPSYYYKSVMFQICYDSLVNSFKSFFSLNLLQIPLFWKGLANCIYGLTSWPHSIFPSSRKISLLISLPLRTEEII